jgi:RHS repeat-associated protein
MMASPGVSNYTYDGNGNETATSSGDSFSYNAKNQTTAFTHGVATVSGLSYADADQTQRTAVGQTTFANSPLGVMIAKNGGVSTYYVRDNHGQIVGQRTPGGSHWYFMEDGLGSVAAVVSGDGNQIGARYAYDPYGQVSCKPTPSSCKVSNPWQFAGGFLDSTGLYKFGSRYYDASLGRWTQADAMAGSIVNPSGVNRYTYASDDPTNSVDPSGAMDCGAANAAMVLSIFAGSVGLLIPPLGLVAGFGAAALDPSQGEFGVALLDAAGGLPGLGLAFRLTRVAAAFRVMGLVGASSAAVASEGLANLSMNTKLGASETSALPRFLAESACGWTT